MADTNNPSLFLLLYVVLPLWFFAGFLDWLCHRRENISHTSGYRESVFHLAMLAELGVPLVAAVIFEINAATFALMLSGFILHGVTAYADSRYSTATRRVGPFEQMVHSYLEVLPLTAIALLATMHWPQFVAVFGYGNEIANWNFQWRGSPLLASYIVPFGVAAAVLVVIPFIEEFIRGLRAERNNARRTTL